MSERIGNYHRITGNLEHSLFFFEQFHQLEKELADACPQNVEFKNNLAISYSKLGSFYEDKLQDFSWAKEHYHQSKKLLLELASRFPSYAQFKQNLDWVTRKLPDEADE